MNTRDIIEHILDEIILDDFRASMDMIEDGLIDSFDMIQILTAIEDELDVVIDTGDIERDDFKDVASIEALIKRAMNQK